MVVLSPGRLRPVTDAAGQSRGDVPPSRADPRIILTPREVNVSSHLELLCGQASLFLSMQSQVHQRVD